MPHTGSESISQNPCHSRFSSDVAGLKGGFRSEFGSAEAPFVAGALPLTRRFFVAGGIDCVKLTTLGSNQLIYVLEMELRLSEPRRVVASAIKYK